jgi:hypothetical protein
MMDINRAMPNTNVRMKMQTFGYSLTKDYSRLVSQFPACHSTVERRCTYIQFRGDVRRVGPFEDR